MWGAVDQARKKIRHSVDSLIHPNTMLYKVGILRKRETPFWVYMQRLKQKILCPYRQGPDVC